VAHKGTREAMAYLINHREGLRRYCDDGCLPNSNIRVKHVAKAIAVPHKKFLFVGIPCWSKGQCNDLLPIGNSQDQPSLRNKEFHGWHQR